MIDFMECNSPNEIWDFFRKHTVNEPYYVVLAWFRDNPINARKKFELFDGDPKFLVTKGEVLQFIDKGNGRYSIKIGNKSDFDGDYYNYIEVLFDEESIDASSITIGDHVAISLCGDYEYSSGRNKLKCFCYDFSKCSTSVLDGYANEYGAVYTYDTIESIVNKWKIKHPSYKENPSSTSSSSSSGCYIATAVYGSYDCPAVCVLRRFRDDMLAKNMFGRIFIRAYYLVSPTIVKLFGQAKWFNDFWKSKLDRLVIKLRARGIDDNIYHD